MPKVVVDTNVLVAMIDKKDNWHPRTKSLVENLETEQDLELVYFDCVVNEAISVLGRRLEEQKRSNEFALVLDTLNTQIPEQLIVWVSLDIKKLYNQILGLVKQTSGRLNFHDALIALECRELKIEHIMSFDQDFDQIDWITRKF